MSAPLLKYLTEFLEYLEIEKNRSRLTIRKYAFYLGRFIEWFGGTKKPESISAEDIRKYRLWLNRLEDVHGEPLKKNTQNYHLIAIRSFLKYLAKRDIKSLAAEKIELMKMPDRDISFLDGSDLNRLLDAPFEVLRTHNKRAKKEDKNDNAPLIAHRDKTILEMLFSTGLRVSELAKLKKDDVNLKRDEFTVRGKGSKSRVVFLSEQAKYWAKKYLDLRADFNPYMFVSHDRRGRTRKQKNTETKEHRNKRTEEQRDQPLTSRSIERLVQKYARFAGITKPVTPHTLRHSFATDLLHNGADIRSVQTMLGHSSITTTQIYTHVTDAELRNIHKKFHGKQRGGG